MQNKMSLQFPTIKRRLICMVYECFLLAAVLMLAGGVWLLITLNHHNMVLDHLRTVWIFAVTGVYFVWQWIDSGHTLAMKTWRIKLVMPGESKVPTKVAVSRYLLLLCYYLPAFFAYQFLSIHDKNWASAVLLSPFLMLVTAVFNKDRQFLHDRLLGTYLIQLPKRSKAQADIA